MHLSLTNFEVRMVTQGFFDATFATKINVQLLVKGRKLYQYKNTTLIILLRSVLTSVLNIVFLAH